MDRPPSKHRHSPPDPRRNGDARHTPHLDTVAQKPTHIGSGAPTADPHPAAHKDHDHPTPGAQPPLEAPASLREPEHVAAGLKAILQGAKFTFSQMGLGRGISDWFR